MAELTEVADARDLLRSEWKRHGLPDVGLAPLHCVVSYPTPPAEANLRQSRRLATLGETIGYSDHTLGIEAATLAVAAGARVIEKHFTLEKDQSDFRDHQLAADPTELLELVRSIKHVQELMGRPGKSVSAAELRNQCRWCGGACTPLATLRQVRGSLPATYRICVLAPGCRRPRLTGVGTLLAKPAKAGEPLTAKHFF